MNWKEATIRDNMWAGKQEGYSTTVSWGFVDVNGNHRTGHRTNYLQTWAEARRFCRRYKIEDQLTTINEEQKPNLPQHLDPAGKANAPQANNKQASQLI